MLTPRKEQSLNRIRLGLDGGRDLSFLPIWMERNTSHPKDTSRPWSFDGHEFQREIVKSMSYPEISVIKCSQVGLSEIGGRMVLAYVAMRQPTQAIYTLQTAAFANTHCTTRLNPMIASSRTLSALLDKETDNNHLKKIGTSFLHIAGASQGIDPISIPASALFHDEVDFSDSDVLTTYQSRIGHEAEGEHHTVRFSTPTVKGRGIHLFYERSSQGRYAVKCDHCLQWQMPTFFEHVVVPGLSKPLIYIEKVDFDDRSVRWKEAKLVCPGCGKTLTVANLADPGKREWVHAYPDREHRGFKVCPFDVPTINPVHRTLLQLRDYRYKFQWVNQKVGETYEDAETNILPDVVERNTVLPRSEFSECPTVMGVDIGKTSWVVVGQSNGSYIDVIYVASIVTPDLHDSTLGQEILTLVQRFSSVMTVVDAMPDFTTAQVVVRNLPVGAAFGSYYTRSTSRRKLEGSEIKLDKGIVNSSRTATFDDLAKDINTGMVRFCRSPEMEVVKSHLANMKRVTRVDAAGDLIGDWESVGPDHFAHALNYMRIGFTLLDEATTAQAPPPPIHITSLRLPFPGDREELDEDLPWGRVSNG